LVNLVKVATSLPTVDVTFFKLESTDISNALNYVIGQRLHPTVPEVIDYFENEHVRWQQIGVGQERFGRFPFPKHAMEAQFGYHSDVASACANIDVYTVVAFVSVGPASYAGVGRNCDHFWLDRSRLDRSRLCRVCV
jgi:hypothetical protein